MNATTNCRISSDLFNFIFFLHINIAVVGIANYSYSSGWDKNRKETEKFSDPKCHWSYKNNCLLFCFKCGKTGFPCPKE